MEDATIILRRLSLIKTLYSIGRNQSFQLEPFNCFSVLTMHDSVEMFLQFAAETKHVKHDKFSFMDYWSQDKLELELKGKMDAFNKRRVQLKHKGILMAKDEVEISRVVVDEFFIIHCRKLFGMSFSEINLFELIRFPETRDLLKEAQSYLDSNEYENCLKSASKSFCALIFEYKTNSANTKILGIFDRVNEIGEMGGRNANPAERKVNTAIKKINSNFEKIESTLEMSLLGIDYNKYRRFVSATPSFYRHSNGKYTITRECINNLNANNCEFVIQFVFESVIKLQDYVIPKIQISPPSTPSS